MTRGNMIWFYLMASCVIGENSTVGILDADSSCTNSKGDNSSHSSVHCARSKIDNTSLSPDEGVFLTVEPNNVTEEGSLLNETDSTNGPGSRPQMSAANLRLRSATKILAPIAIITGYIGSVLTIILLSKGTLKSSASVYMIALAISDLLYISMNVPHVMNGSYMKSFPAWKMIYAYFDVYVSESLEMFYAWGVWITICLTMERYIAVCYPMKIHLMAKGSRAKIIIISLLLLIIAASATRFFRRVVTVKFNPMTNQTIYIKEITPLGASETYTAAIFWSFAFITVIIPFPILLILNAAIIFNLRKLSLQRKLLTGITDRSGDEAYKSRDNQITRILIGVVIAFFICNFLNTIRYIELAIEGPKNYKPDFVSIMVSGTLALYNPTANFVLYICCSKAMRQAFVHMVTFDCPGRFTEKTETSNKTGKSSVLNDNNGETA